MQVQQRASPLLCWWRRSSPGATWPKKHRAKSTVSTGMQVWSAFLQLLARSGCYLLPAQPPRYSWHGRVGRKRHHRRAGEGEKRRGGGCYACMLDWNGFWVDPGINLKLEEIRGLVQFNISQTLDRSAVVNAELWRDIMGFTGIKRDRWALRYSSNSAWEFFKRAFGLCC